MNHELKRGVNKMNRMTENSGERLLALVTENLADGLKLQYEHNPLQGRSEPYGWATIATPDGKTFRFQLETKWIHRKETLIALRERMAHLTQDMPVLLICNRLTPALEEYCHKHQLNFLDTAGNARIQTSGLYILVKGRVEKKTISAKSRFAEGVMKLLFVLLTRPDMLNQNYRDIAAQSGISLGMVSKAFDFLEAQKYLRRANKERRLMNIEELEILWLRDYATSLRPKLSSIILTAPEDWQEVCLLSGEFWSGEVAAVQLSEGYLIPENGIIFTPYSLLQRRRELALRPEKNGKLQLFSSFWGHEFAINQKAQVMLCIAELLASVDDRNKETARIINGKYLQLNESALFSY
ncbi:type IV toxin-antitoxin system AbiEi family antitoxin [Rahnella inusitata]|uniref:type IV toxin-antitoxin system AbiEi family antitoxin n=1 Tax=Rahnella inusitata TaxID=58169 RepID=UPI0039AFFA6F